jgi:hypothetical protein
LSLGKWGGCAGGHNYWDLEGEVAAHDLYRGWHVESPPTALEQSFSRFPRASSLPPFACLRLLSAFTSIAFSLRLLLSIAVFLAVASSSSPFPAGLLSLVLITIFLALG